MLISKFYVEIANRGVLRKKVFLEISPNLHENTVTVSLFQ